MIDIRSLALINGTRRPDPQTFFIHAATYAQLAPSCPIHTRPGPGRGIFLFPFPILIWACTVYVSHVSCADNLPEENAGGGVQAFGGGQLATFRAIQVCLLSCRTSPFVNSQFSILHISLTRTVQCPPHTRKYIIV